MNGNAPSGPALTQEPLIRLLAGNLAAGAALALLMFGGLLALDPQHLRELVFADQSAAAAIALLLSGLVITFGSAAMGGAIMLLGASRADPGQRKRLATARIGTNPLVRRRQSG